MVIQHMSIAALRAASLVPILSVGTCQQLAWRVSKHLAGTHSISTSSNDNSSQHAGSRTQLLLGMSDLHGQKLLGMPVTAAALPDPNVIQLPPRVKGVARKFLLRALNKAVIARVARRATIGIPALGFYFGCRMLVKDSYNLAAKWQHKDYLAASFLGIAVLCTVVDLMAQTAVIHGICTGALGMPLPAVNAAWYGFAALPQVLAMLPTADRISLMSAGTSCVAGLLSEACSIQQHDDKGH